MNLVVVVFLKERKLKFEPIKKDSPYPELSFYFLSRESGLYPEAISRFMTKKRYRTTIKTNKHTQSVGLISLRLNKTNTPGANTQTVMLY
jgi:hypothetical protein